MFDMMRLELQNYKTLDTFLENTLVQDYESLKKFNNLTESEKKEVSTGMIQKLYETIKTKSLKVDYGDLERTRGDIKRSEAYEPLKNAINTLVKMHSQSEDAPDTIPILKNSLEIIEKHTREFQDAFNKNQELKKMTYVNFSFCLINATSTMIAESIEFFKDPNAGYRTSFKAEDRDRKDDYFIKCLENLVKIENNGQLRTFLGNNEEIIQESAFLSTIVNNASLIIVSTLAILFNIRTIVFMGLKFRTDLSDRILTLAYFVDTNTQVLDNKDGKNNKKIINKQKNIVKKLIHLSEKISIDSSLSKRDIDRDIEQNNKEIEKDIESGDIDLNII